MPSACLGSNKYNILSPWFDLTRVRTRAYDWGGEPNYLVSVGFGNALHGAPFLLPSYCFRRQFFMAPPTPIGAIFMLREVNHTAWRQGSIHSGNIGVSLPCACVEFMKQSRLFRSFVCLSTPAAQKVPWALRGRHAKSII